MRACVHVFTINLLILALLFVQCFCFNVKLATIKFGILAQDKFSLCSLTVTKKSKLRKLVCGSRSQKYTCVCVWCVCVCTDKCCMINNQYNVFAHACDHTHNCMNAWKRA